MKKPFLLMAGSYPIPFYKKLLAYYQYPSSKNCIQCYETYEEALSQVEVITHCEYYKKGKNKGLIKNSYETYNIQGIKHDWYKILDLKENYEVIREVLFTELINELCKN